MGDLANMTDCDGRVHGPRLLRWLRSREKMEHGEAKRCAALRAEHRFAYHAGKADLLGDMADDLERELTPPNYPEDDDGAAGPGDRVTGPCEGCGRLADRVPVQDNGRVWLACPACAARADDDAVDLDDPAFLGRPERG